MGCEHIADAAGQAWIVVRGGRLLTFASSEDGISGVKVFVV